jgi:hypothetical protein
VVDTTDMRAEVLDQGTPTQTPLGEQTTQKPEKEPTPREKLRMGIKDEIIKGAVPLDLNDLVDRIEPHAVEFAQEKVKEALKKVREFDLVVVEDEEDKRLKDLEELENKVWTGLQKFILELKNSLPPEELEKVQIKSGDEEGTTITETHIDPAGRHREIIHPLKLVEKEFAVPPESRRPGEEVKEEWIMRLDLNGDKELSGDEDGSSPFFEFTRFSNGGSKVSYAVGGKKHEFNSGQTQTAKEFQQHMELAFGAIKELGVDPYLLGDLLPISVDDLL